MKLLNIVCGVLSVFLALIVNTSVTSAAVKPNAKATAPPLSVVQQVCVPSGYDLVLGEWNYDSGYLYCQVYDSYTGGARVFVQNASGTFSILIKGGGNITPALMEQYGISSSIANTLYNGLHN